MRLRSQSSLSVLHNQPFSEKISPFRAALDCKTGFMAREEEKSARTIEVVLTPELKRQHNTMALISFSMCNIEKCCQ